MVVAAVTIAVAASALLVFFKEAAASSSFRFFPSNNFSLLVSHSSQMQSLPCERTHSLSSLSVSLSLLSMFLDEILESEIMATD